MWYFLASPQSVLDSAPGWLDPGDARVVLEDEDLVYSPILDAPRRPNFEAFTPVRVKAWHGQRPPWLEVGPPLLEGLAKSLGMAQKAIVQIGKPVVVGPRNRLGDLYLLPDEFVRAISAIPDAGLLEVSRRWFKRHGYSNRQPFEEVLRLLIDLTRSGVATECNVYLWTGASIESLPK
jgi:hypothetical protein